MQVAKWAFLEPLHVNADMDRTGWRLCQTNIAKRGEFTPGSYDQIAPFDCVTS